MEKIKIRNVLSVFVYFCFMQSIALIMALFATGWIIDLYFEYHIYNRAIANAIYSVGFLIVQYPAHRFLWWGINQEELLL